MAKVVLLILSRVVAVDLVDLKIGKGSAQDRCANVTSRRVSHHIADRVFTLSRSAILHVYQNGRPIGRARLEERPRVMPTVSGAGGGAGGSPPP